MTWMDALIAMRDPLMLVPKPVTKQPYVNAPWNGMVDKRVEKV